MRVGQFRFHSLSPRSAGALLLVGVLAGVTIGGGVSVIAASTTKSVTVCANKKTNVLRYAKKGKCAKTETRVVLNQKVETSGVPGVAGAKGDAGTNGATGAAGAKGDAGTNGVPGVAGADGTNGTNGADGVNAAFAITQLSVCDGPDVNNFANELCKVGMTGPGGGIIFFVDYNDEYATYNYLEAAPTDAMFDWDAVIGPWSTDTPNCGDTAPQTTNCHTDSIYTETDVDLATIKGLHRGLFGGKAATAAIVARHDAGGVAKNLYAAGVADIYVTATASDWWLPSSEELLKMQANLNNKGLGGFTPNSYWSSSESGRNNAWYQYFFNGWQNDVPSKADEIYVRPVRAF